MDFLQVWALGIFHPAWAFVELREKPAPKWGLAAVAIRFMGSVEILHGCGELGDEMSKGKRGDPSFTARSGL